MANENRVELVIRAKDLARQTIQDLSRTITSLESGLADVDKAGGPASRSVRELKQQLDDLATVSNELGRRRTAVEAFLAQQRAVEALALALDKAKGAYESHKASMAGAAKATADQKSALTQLQKQLTAAQTAYNRANGSLDTQSRKLADLGVSAGSAADELLALAVAENKVDTLSAKAETNIRRRDQALRELAEVSRKNAKFDADLEQRLKANISLQEAAADGARKLAQARAQAQAIGADTSRVDRFAADRLRPEVLQTAERAERAYAAAVAATQKAIAERKTVMARDDFRALAAEANVAAASARQLAYSLKLPAPSVNAGQIAAIVDPAKAAGQSLTSLRQVLDKIDATPVAGQLDAVRAATVPLSEGLKTVERAAKGLDTLAAQREAVKDAAASYRTARDRLAELARQVRESEAPNAQLLSQFRQQQAATEAAGRAFGKAAGDMVATRQTLRDMGVDTRNLAQAQQTLATTATRIVGAQRDAATVATLRAAAEKELAARVAENSKLTSTIEAGERRLAAARKVAADAGANLARVDSFRESALRPEVLRTAERAERAYAAAVKATGVALEARKTELARDAFRATADSATQAASAARQLARALVLPPITINTEAIRGIIEPGKQAGQTLAGIKQQLDAVASVKGQAATKAQFDLLTAATVPLAEGLRRVESAARGLDELAVRQAAVRQAGAAFTEAKSKLADLERQMRAAGAPNAELARQFQAQQGALKQAANELGQASARYQETRNSLRAFGVDTRNAAAAQKQLADSASSIIAAQKRVAEATDQSTRAFKLWGEGGRTTLSYAQRLRGEFLSLAASAVGLYSAIEAGKGAIDAAVGREQTTKQLVLITGSAEAAKVKYQELKAVANELGVEFTKASKGYTDIAFAAKEAGVGAGEVDRFYKNLLLTVRDLNLTGEQTDRVFLAVSQIFSKNKLSSEELGQQLGESLKGILGISAQASGLVARDFQKALEAGSFTGDAIISIIDKYREKLGGLGAQSEGYVQAQARFNTAVNDLKLALADTGFLDSFTKLIKSLTEGINRGEFQGLVDGIGLAFRGLAEAARLVSENLKPVLFLMGGLVAQKILMGLVALNAQLVASGGAAAFLSTNMSGVAASTTAAATGLSLVLGAGVAAAAAVAYLDRKFATFHETVVLVVGGLSEMFGLFTASSPTEWAERASKAMGRLKEQAAQVALAWGGGDKKVEPAAPSVPAGRTGTSQLEDYQKRLASEKMKAQAQAGAIKSIDDDLQKAATKVRAKEAENRGDTLSKVKADFEDTQKAIDELAKTDAKLAAQKQKQLDDVIRATAAANAPKASIKDMRAANAAVLEQITNSINAAKADVEAGLKALDRSYQLSLVSIEEYYRKRIAAARQTEQLEVDGYLKQIAILETTRAKDPQAAKQIEALWGKVTAAAQESALKQQEAVDAMDAALKQARTAAAQTEEALLKLRGDNLTPALREAGREYEGLVLAAQKLSGVERDRAQAIAEQTFALRSQMAQLEAIRAQGDYLNQATQAAIDSSNLGPWAQAAAQEEANRAQVARLQEIQARYVTMGAAGTQAAQQIGLELIRLGNQTDLVADKIAGMAKAATTDLIAEMSKRGTNVSDWFGAFGKSLANSLASSFADEASSMMAAAVKDAIKSMRSAADSSGGWGSLLGGLLGSGGSSGASAGVDYGQFFHTGGTVGFGGGGMRRSLSASPMQLAAAVASAPRYHTGAAGLGLRSDEVMAVLKKREEVLAANDPRNILNGGAAAGGQPVVPASQPSIKIVNTINPVDVVNEGLGTAAGEKVMVNAIARNSKTIRKVLGV